MATVTRKKAYETQSKLEEMNQDYKIDLSWWIMHGQPMITRVLRLEGSKRINLSIYYNYQKDLVTKVELEKIESESDGFIMTQKIKEYESAFEPNDRATLKKLLDKAKDFADYDLSQHIETGDKIKIERGA